MRVCSCAETVCSDPSPVNNSVHSDPITGKYLDMITYTCNDGYLTEDGYLEVNVTCTSFSQWLPNDFTCDGININKILFGLNITSIHSHACTHTHTRAHTHTRSHTRTYSYTSTHVSILCLNFHC